MISYQEAITLIEQQECSKDSETIALKHAEGRILAEDIVSDYDHPFFDNSTVDGYGIRFSERNEILKINGEISAGDVEDYHLLPGTAVRIFTGAPIPAGVDTVVMQEFVERHDNCITINDKNLQLGSNIRKKGGQIKKGTVTLKKGCRITASGIGFLASIGRFSVEVYKKPEISILVTGNEFLEENESMTPGKIYDSNGPMLQAALDRMGLNCTTGTVKDDLSELKNRVEQAIKTANLLIITGGVSVGDYDFTKAALESVSFQTVFHKVRQKPGKPILLMKRADGKIAVGLPGNPQSAIIGLYIYVWPILMKKMGAVNSHLPKVTLPCLHEIKRPDDQKTHFIAGSISEKGFMAGTIQASHMLLSMAQANAIGVVPEDKLLIREGDLITSYLIG
ncbi:MAG: molybdopterin molybdotransferase MoeA [Chitinophagales bacterium]